MREKTLVAYVKALQAQGCVCEKGKPVEFVAENCRGVRLDGRCFQCSFGQRFIQECRGDERKTRETLSGISEKLLRGRPVEIRIRPRGAKLQSALSGVKEELAESIVREATFQIFPGDEESLEGILGKASRLTGSNPAVRLLSCRPFLAVQGLLLKAAILCLRHSYQIVVKFQ